MFYATKGDLLDTTATYFKAGLQSNEFCVWAICNPITECDAVDALRLTIPRLAIPRFDRHRAAGQFELLAESNAVIHLTKCLS